MGHEKVAEYSHVGAPEYSERSPHPAAISARGLRVERGGAEVLRGLTFEVARGTVTGLLGPSGCGKTTLMRALVGVQRRVEGDLRVLGAPAGAADLRHRVAYVTQAPSVYGDLSVAENLAYFAALAGAGPDEVGEVTRAVELTDVVGRPVNRLSGGQRARVSLASALLGHPELLVLDEPTVGLDPVLRRALWALFGRLAAGGTTLLVSSHVMDEARHCEELLLMRDGILVARETPAGLARRTGTTDLEEAFLRLIAASEDAGAGS
jgi:ABC-2 type transport system ATP-binding protein